MKSSDVESCLHLYPPDDVLWMGSHRVLQADDGGYHHVIRAAAHLLLAI